MKEIKLTNSSLLALVDDEDYERLSKFDWLLNEGYAYFRRGQTYMHQMLIKCEPEFRPDHVDRNKLNCQKLNLRSVTDSENGFNRGVNTNNSSGYKGVSFASQRNKWEAKICVKGKTIHLGRHDTARGAAMAYNEAAKRLIGDCAYLNPV